MQKRFAVCALTMLSITCGAALAAQLTPAQRIDRVTTPLKSLETRALRPLAYIGSSYAQHNLQVADGPAGVRELVLHPPAATTVHTVRIFTDGDYVVAQTDYNFGGPKVGFYVFRFDGDNIVEHWDNLQNKCAALQIRAVALSSMALRESRTSIKPMPINNNETNSPMRCISAGDALRRSGQQVIY